MSQLSAEPSKITYVSPMPQDVTDEDRVIGTTDLGLTPDRITIVKAEELFEQ